MCCCYDGYKDTKVSVRQRCVFLGVALHLYAEQAARRKLHECSRRRRWRCDSDAIRQEEQEEEEQARHAKYLVDARSSMRAQSICKMLIDSLVVNQFGAASEMPKQSQSQSQPQPKNGQANNLALSVGQSGRQSARQLLSPSSLAASHKLVAAEAAMLPPLQHPTRVQCNLCGAHRGGHSRCSCSRKGQLGGGGGV